MGNKLQHGHVDADDGGTLSTSIGIVPTGGILSYGGSAAPSGYLLCDGSAVSRTTYSALFTVLGTSFGSGDGSTTFNVPDLRGRSPLGSGNGPGLTSRSIGNTGGEETHVLSTGELAQHTHAATVTDPGHGHDINYHIRPAAWTGASVAAQAGDQSSSDYPMSAISTTTGVTVSNSNTGSNTAHNTMHPFTVTNFIIKI